LFTQNLISEFVWKVSICLENLKKLSAIKALFILVSTGHYTKQLTTLVGKAVNSDQLLKFILDYNKKTEKKSKNKNKTIPAP
jgi:hypothetical protein